MSNAKLSTENRYPAGDIIPEKIRGHSRGMASIKEPATPIGTLDDSCTRNDGIAHEIGCGQLEVIIICHKSVLW